MAGKALTISPRKYTAMTLLIQHELVKQSTSASGRASRYRVVTMMLRMKEEGSKI